MTEKSGPLILNRLNLVCVSVSLSVCVFLWILTEVCFFSAVFSPSSLLLSAKAVGDGARVLKFHKGTRAVGGDWMWGSSGARGGEAASLGSYRVPPYQTLSHA